MTVTQATDQSSFNLATWLQRTAAARPDAPALAQGDRALTYGELGERVARLAASFQAEGLRAGDRVGLLMWNCPELLEVLLAGFHAGLTVVPINGRSTPVEAEQILRDAQVSAFVYGPEYVDHARTIAGQALLLALERDELTEKTLDDAVAAATETSAPAALPADHVAWLFYTSGTTGAPKGAMLTHRNLQAMVMAYLADVRALEPSSVVLHAAPLTHGSGLYALAPIARGAAQVITSSRSYDPAEILRLLSERGVTDIAFLSPTMLNWLLDEHRRSPGKIETLENIVYGGAPMHREDLVRACEALGPRLTQIYGQAEAPVTITRLTREDHRHALASDPELLLSAGTPYTNVDIAVRGEDGSITPTGYGEILTRSDAVMRGYWGNEAATEETLRDGWLHTGDVGRITENRTLFLLDRNKDVIISGGANVYPREVEEVVLEHPKVRQVAVVGAPDPEWGERVVAAVVPEDGADAARLREEITAFCRERLSGYKIPRQIDFRAELPTSAYGKVLKRELRDEYWQGQERSI